MIHSRVEDTRPAEWFDEEGIEDEEFLDLEDQFNHLMKIEDKHDSTAK